MTENYALTHLYHNSGAKIDIPMPVDTEFSTVAASLLYRSLDNLIAAGFSVYAPSLEEGEQLEQISYIVRREKANGDGSITPIIDLYTQQGNFRQLGLYLNTDVDEIAFENATGLLINSLPVYEGEGSIERGKNPKLDKYVVPTARQAKVVFKLNPRWEGEGDKKHAKRMFVRWEGVKPDKQEQAHQTLAPVSTPAPVPAQAPAPQQPKAEPVSSTPVPPTAGKEYPKLGGELVGMLAHTTGLKNSVIAQALAKHPGKTISFDAALSVVTSALQQAEA